MQGVMLVPVREDRVEPSLRSFQKTTTPYKTVKSFCSYPTRVRDLLSELEALSNVLASLVSLIKPNSDADLSVLDLPLLRCGNVCKEFQQELQYSDAYPNQTVTGKASATGPG